MLVACNCSRGVGRGGRGLKWCHCLLLLLSEQLLGSLHFASIVHSLVPHQWLWSVLQLLQAASGWGGGGAGLPNWQEIASIFTTFFGSFVQNVCKVSSLLLEKQYPVNWWHPLLLANAN